jgi:hypothetical protein
LAGSGEGECVGFVIGINELGTGSLDILSQNGLAKAGETKDERRRLNYE